MNIDITIPPEAKDTLPIRPPIISPEGVIRIDNSSLERFTTCARSAQYYLVDRREPSGLKSALYFGSAIHAALEIFYGEYDGKVTEVLPEFLMKVQAAMEPMFPANQDVDEWRTLDKAMETIISYVAATEFDIFQVYQHDNKPFVEQYFELPMGDILFQESFDGIYHERLQVMWTGRIDLIVKQDHALWVMDHKTTSIVGQNFFADFLNSSQALGYVWAAQQLLGQEVSGLYLNAIAARKPSKTGKPFELGRQKFPYDQSRIEEWHYNTLTLIGDFCANLQRNFFPMETKWCVGKYGQCPYLDICSLPPQGREMVLHSNLYQNVTWTPKK